MSYAQQSRKRKSRRLCFFTKDEDTLHETIEAQAGEYCRERARALRDAILASDDPKKEADLKELDTFFTSVYHHVAFKRMTPYEQRSKYGSGGHEYENARINAHNDVIEHLNRLNNLVR